MLSFNGPLPHLVLPPNHWIKLVAIVLHCLYWELLEFTKKNKIKIKLGFFVLFFKFKYSFFSLPHPHTQKKKNK